MKAQPKGYGSTDLDLGQRVVFVECEWPALCAVMVVGGGGGLEVGGGGVSAERSYPRRPWRGRVPVFECERVTSGLERV